MQPMAGGKRLHILVTNDDGVSSAGLSALGRALSTLGKVTILAPDHNWSAGGHNRTMHKPLRIDPLTLQDGSKALASNGAPSDCVALAVLGALGEPIDLVVSGINLGANLGDDITYSGTVAAAMEAVINGLPAIAVSLDCSEPGADFGPAAEVARRVVVAVARQGLPQGAFLNVNVPNRPLADMLGARLTRLGRRVYRDVLVQRQDPRGRPYYWIGGEPSAAHSRSVEADEGTDIWALARCHVSLTPIHMDMTAYSLFRSLEPLEASLAEAP
jgi:5'-nucleotidase